MGILVQLSYGIHYHIQETKYCTKAKENNTMKKISLYVRSRKSHTDVLLETLLVPFVLDNQSLPQAKHPVTPFKGFEGNKHKP